MNPSIKFEGAFPQLKSPLKLSTPFESKDKP
jgi:hypothetical protein